MKKLVLGLVVLLLFYSEVIPQDIDWTKVYSCTGTSSNLGTFQDFEGNLFVIGDYTGTITVDSLNYGSTNYSSYIIKYNQFGFLQWVKILGAPGNIVSTGFAYDDNNYCYITGGLVGTVNFDSIQAVGGTYRHPFIAKMDLDGNFIWVRIASGNGADDYSNGITVDQDGNQYIIGSIVGTLHFGNHTIGTRGFNDIFVAKCDSAGNFLWAKSFGSSNKDDYGRAITCDDSSNIYVIGSFGGTSYFGSHILTSFGANDISLTKMDENGNILWLKQFGGTSEDWPSGISKFRDSSVGITGFFHSGSNGAHFDDFVLYSNDGSRDIFISKINTVNGNVVWANDIGGNSNDNSRGIGSNSNNGILLSGDFVGQITLNDTTFLSKGEADIIICKYSQNGSLIKAVTYGTIKNDRASDLFISNSNEIYLCGGINGDLIPFSTVKDGILIKLTDHVLPVELVSFTIQINKSVIQLGWQTASELNNQGFEIERKEVLSPQSSVSKEEWNVLGFVNGKGTTTEPQAYSFADKNLEAGKYQYRLKQIDFDGTFEYSNTIEVEINSPTKFSLEQNYPNPFNPSTSIQYAISSMQFVTIKVYDVLGKEVATLVNEEKPVGNYEVEFNSVETLHATSLPSGVYFYQLSAGDYIETKKMILLK